VHGTYFDTRRYAEYDENLRKIYRLLMDLLKKRRINPSCMRTDLFVKPLAIFVIEPQHIARVQSMNVIYQKFGFL